MMGILIEIVFGLMGATATICGVYYCLSSGVARQDAARLLTRLSLTAIGVIRDKIFGYIVEAEKKFGGGTGALKLSYVLNAVTESAYYNALPDAVRQMLTTTELTELIDLEVEKKLKPAMQYSDGVRVFIGVSEG